MKTFVVICAAFAAIPASAADSGPIVKITGGQVRGATLGKGGAVFRGIPYAALPVGELSWREPMPVRTWTGVREATAFGLLCAPPQVANAVDTQVSAAMQQYWTDEDQRSKRWAIASVAQVRYLVTGGHTIPGYGSGSERGPSASILRPAHGERRAPEGEVIGTLNKHSGGLQ